MGSLKTRENEESRGDKWYAVNTKRNQEHVAAANLKNLGLEVFSPRIRTVEKLFGSPVEIIRSLFPNYIFARLDVGRRYNTVKHTFGVRQIVGFGNDPAPVSDDIIALIKDRVDDDDLLEMKLKSFKSGDQVEVVAGTLAGLNGVLEREMSGSERVAVLLNAISFQATLLIRRDNLKRVVEGSNSAIA
jgi:transcriptional antiterminator RfaH